MECAELGQILASRRRGRRALALELRDEFGVLCQHRIRDAIALGRPIGAVLADLLRSLAATREVEVTQRGVVERFRALIAADMEVIGQLRLELNALERQYRVERVNRIQQLEDL